MAIQISGKMEAETIPRVSQQLAVTSDAILCAPEFALGAAFTGYVSHCMEWGPCFIMHCMKTGIGPSHEDGQQMSATRRSAHHPCAFLARFECRRASWGKNSAQRAVSSAPPQDCVIDPRGVVLPRATLEWLHLRDPVELGCNTKV